MTLLVALRSPPPPSVSLPISPVSLLRAPPRPAGIVKFPIPPSFSLALPVPAVRHDSRVTAVFRLLPPLRSMSMSGIGCLDFATLPLLSIYISRPSQTFCLPVITVTVADTGTRGSPIRLFPVQTVVVG